MRYIVTCFHAVNFALCFLFQGGSPWYDPLRRAWTILYLFLGCMGPSIDFLSCHLFYSLGRFILRFFSQAFVRGVRVFFHPARLFPAIVFVRRFKGCFHGLRWRGWVGPNAVIFLRLLYLRPLQDRYSCDWRFIARGTTGGRALCL